MGGVGGCVGVWVGLSGCGFGWVCGFRWVCGCVGLGGWIGEWLVCWSFCAAFVG